MVIPLLLASSLLLSFLSFSPFASFNSGIQGALAARAAPVDESPSARSEPVELFQLTPETFKPAIASGDWWFVEYFSPSCIHCRRFKPTWEKLVDEAKTEFPDVKLAQVNCALFGDFCNENKIQGYPTLLLYNSGKKVKEFSGDRELPGIKHFLHEHVPAHSPHHHPEDPPHHQIPSHGDLDLETETPPASSNDEPEHEEPFSVHSALNPEGRVLSLSAANFDSTLSYGPMFIKFFAPWCGHCKRLAPIWNQLAKQTKNGRATIAEVNCDEHGALCKRWKIEGYPTLLFLRNMERGDGKEKIDRIEYTSGRKLDQLASFVEKATAPALQLLRSPTELQTKIKETNVLYLLLVRKKPSKGLLDVFREVSSPLLGQPPVVYSTSHELFETYNIPEHEDVWALVALKDHNAHRASSIFLSSYLSSPHPHPEESGSRAASMFSAMREPQSPLSTWLRTHRLPTSLELTQDTFQTVMNAPEEPLVVIAAFTTRNKARVERMVANLVEAWRVKTHGTGRIKVRDGRAVGWLGNMNDGGEKVEQERNEREVIFTWMDAEKWKDWMVGMYGAKMTETEKEIAIDVGQFETVENFGVVISDYKRLIYWDQDAKGERLDLSRKLFGVIQDAVDGRLAYKHSENRAERLARILSGGLVFSQNFVTEHPMKFCLYITALAFVVVWLVKKKMSAEMNRYPRTERLD